MGPAQVAVAPAVLVRNWGPKQANRCCQACRGCAFGVVVFGRGSARRGWAYWASNVVYR